MGNKLSQVTLTIRVSPKLQIHKLKRNHTFQSENKYQLNAKDRGAWVFLNVLIPKGQCFHHMT